MSSKKIILDTNIWISYFISNQFDFLDDFISTGKVQLIFSNELLDEFLTVAQRVKFQKYFTQSNVSDLLKIFNQYGKLVKVISSIDKCRDYKDNFLLNLAIDSKADYLITGDNDLLVMAKIGKTKILTWTEFLTVFESNNPR